MAHGEIGLTLATRYRRWPKGDAPAGWWVGENILSQGWWERAATRGARAEEPLVAWSGWLGADPSSADGAVERDLRTWSGEGRRRLDEVIAATLGGEGSDRAAKVRILWLLPHAGHVLSDGVSCASFLRAHEGLVASGRLGLLLDIDLLITPDMRARREDHLVRLVESAIAMGRGVAAVVMPRGDWEGAAGRLAGAGLAPSVERLERAERGGAS